MAENGKEESIFSEKMMVGDDVGKTVEFLRGRLLAERQTSRAAKQEAELLGTKVIELENQVKVETRLRVRSQKKLKILMKRLGSLNILPPSDEFERYSSTSGICSSSCTATFISNSDPATRDNL